MIDHVLVMVWRKMRSVLVWCSMNMFGKRRSSQKIRAWGKSEKHRRSLSKPELSSASSVLPDSSACSLDDELSPSDEFSGTLSDSNAPFSIKESDFCKEDNTASSAEEAVFDRQDISGMAKQAAKAVVDFEKRARKLLRFHHASLVEKLLLTFKYKFARSHEAIITEGQNLISYASKSANEIQKLLQNCQKGKLSAEENKYKNQLQAMRVRFLRSRWLIELIAVYMNSNHSTASSYIPQLTGTSNHSVESEGEKYSVSFTLTDSLKIELDLTCPICLETVFEPVSLRCGHIFCFSCACDAACVLPLEGLEAACNTSKCPTCRKKGVFAGALHLKGLNTLIKNRCKEQWEERRKIERFRRLQQAKEYWNGQIAMMMAK